MGTEPTISAAPAGFSGWHRPLRGRWVRLVSAATEAAAWDALLGALASRPAGDAMVLPSDRLPGDSAGQRPTRARYPRRAAP